jgi:hypothetical protein
MTNLTSHEINYLNIIARCEMNQLNGGVPTCADDVNTYVWADERAANMGISEKAIGGVMASLVKKELIGVHIEKSNLDDSGVWFTEAGFAAWNSHPNADKVN